MSSLLPFLSTACLQVTAWLGLGLLVSHLLDRRPALAHRVLVLAVAGALLTPAATLVVRQAGWGLLPAPAVAETPVELAAPLSAARPAVVTAREEPGAMPSPAGPVAAPETGGVSVDPAQVGLLVWAAASLLLLARLLAAAVSAIRVAGSARAVPNRSLRLAVAKAGRLRKLRRVPTVRSSPRVRSPMVWGWSPRPILLVPESGLGDPDRWPPLIDHEIAHLVRRDHVVALLAEVLVLLLPWHPFAWWTRRRLARQCERACDDWVLGHGHPAPDYAESLLGIAARSRAALSPAAAGLHSGLSGRVRRILRSERRPLSPGRGLGIASLLVLLGIAAVALAQEGAPAEQPSKPPEAAGPAPVPVAKGPELHVVGVYEGVYAPGVGHHHFGSVSVKVTRRVAPIVLALTSYEPVDWKITLGPGVKLEKVVVSGYYRQRVEGIGKTPLSVQTWQDDKQYPFTGYEDGGAKYLRLCRVLREMTGLEVTSFQGQYAADAAGFVIGPGPRETGTEVSPEERARLRERYGSLEFHAVVVHGREAFWKKCTPLGPTREKGIPVPAGMKHVVPDESVRRFYALGVHDAYTLKAGEKPAQKIDYGRDVAALSWPSGMALDTKRNRLVLAVRGGQGIEAFDLKTREWTPFLGDSRPHLHRALVYDEGRDLVHALTGDGMLFSYSAAGGIVTRVRLSGDVDIGRQDRVQLAVAGDHLVVLVGSRCLVVLPKTGRVVYGGTWQ